MAGSLGYRTRIFSQVEFPFGLYLCHYYWPHIVIVKLSYFLKI